MDKSKYKRLASLYATGTELVLQDDIVLWMQVVNSFEYDECRNAAQVARARLSLALRDEGSDELTKMRAQIEGEGREQMISLLADARQGEWMVKATQEIMDDPEWSERIEIMERSDEADATPLSEDEKKILAKINNEYFAEVNERMEAERNAEVRRLEMLSDDDLQEEYLDLWIERRGGETAMANYRLYESYYAARACAGVQGEDGKWDHSACEGHRERAFDTVEEVRELPDDLQELMVQTMAELNLTVRQAKDSGSATSSSDSSPQPTAPEDSEASAPEEAPSTPPGS